jgi:ABC-2 type transport system ATP-binding protein
MHHYQKQSMTHFQNYKKLYGKTEVIGIIDCLLPHGIYWLKGANGTGKTTLMKSIAGLIPYSGTITVNNKDIRKQRTEYTTIVNYAEAEPLYPGFLTGNDIINFYAQTKKVSSQQIDTLSHTLGINAYKTNKVATYSSGMTKKLSLVTAFVGTPQLILLDEPLITLDINAVATLQQLIATYHNDGVTFIITSHQQLHITGCSVQELIIDNKTIVLP